MSTSSQPSATAVKLRAVIDEGIARDLYRVIRAEMILRETSFVAEAINKAGYAELFGTLQEHSFASMVLGLARIFDRSHAKNPTRSVQELERILSTQAAGVPIIDRPYLEGRLAEHGVGGLGGESDPEVLAHVAAVLGRIGTDAEAHLDGVRKRRDKFLAHHDVKAGPSSAASVVVGDVEKLVDLAIQVLDLTSRPLLNVVHVNEGRFFLGDQAKRVRGPLRRLLRTAGVIEGDPGFAE